jgi:serine/threonine protein kinase
MGSPTHNHGQPSEGDSRETHLSVHPSGDADFSTETAAPYPLRGAHSPMIGQSIGTYLIRSVLGEGGFGVVYLAEQSLPVRRRVALKVIKPGMDTKAVIARFEAERQALAMMNHPGVAKVFDAGQTDAGRPYFAMEYVQGVGLGEHCERHKVPLRERLELFMQVCDAVQHAHQKGIIHRDLKPTNVLIQYEAGKPVPKVIDFGVAKALDQRLTERTIFTEQGQLVGTPEYMSPEQAEMSVQDIDTRADIYSLGVILYQLITGSLPFDPETLRSEGFAGIQRIIREVEPVKPSTRLAQLAHGDVKTAEEQALRLQSDATALRRQLRGDLDWITMKSLEKDRARRYDTAREFAQDIERFLKHEPVLAGPPTAAYRLRKFVRRNRAALVVASIVLVAMISATAISLRMAWIATEAQGVASKELGEANIARDKEKTQRLRADGETTRAEIQAKRATQVATFLKDVLAAAATAAREGESREAIKTIVDSAAGKLAAAADMDPIVKARVSLDIGRLYRQIDLFQAGLPFLVDAYTTLHNDLPASAEANEATIELAKRLIDAQATSINSARTGRVMTADLIKDILLHARASTGVDSLEYVRAALLCFRYALARKDDAPHPGITLAEAVAKIEANLGPMHEESLDARFLLAQSSRANDAADGMSSQLEQLERDCVTGLGERHTLTMRVCLYRVEAAVRNGITATNREMVEAMLLKLDGADGTTPAAVASLQTSQAEVLREMGRSREAIPFYEHAYELYSRTYGPRHALTLAVGVRLGVSLYSAGRHRPAINLLEEMIAANKSINSHPHFATWLPYLFVAYAHEALGERKEAFDCYMRSRDAMLLAYPDNVAQQIYAYCNFGRGCLNLGRITEARLSAARAAVLRTPTVDVAGYHQLEAQIAAADGQWNAALFYATRNAVLAKRDGRSVIFSLLFLGEIQEQAGKLDDAAKSHMERLKLTRQHLGPQSAAARDVAKSLVRVYRKQGRTVLADSLSSQIETGKLPPNDRIGVDVNQITGDAKAAIALKDWAKAFDILDRAAPAAADLPYDDPVREQHLRLVIQCQWNLGRADAALDLLRQFFEMRCVAGGLESDAAIGAVRLLVESVYSVRGVDEALKEVVRYRERYEKELGLKAMTVGRLLITCSRVFHDANGWQTALGLLEEAGKILDTGDPPLALRYDLLGDIGRVGLRLKKLDVAEAAILQCLQISAGYRSSRFPRHWLYYDLSLVHKERGDRENQLANLRQANELLTASPYDGDVRWADQTRRELVDLLKSVGRHDDARRVTLGQAWSLAPGEKPAAPPAARVTLDSHLAAARTLAEAGKFTAALDEIAKAPADLADAKVTVSQLQMVKKALYPLRVAAEKASPDLDKRMFGDRINGLMTSLDLAGYESAVDAESERAEIALELIILGAHDLAEPIIARSIRVIIEQAGPEDRRLIIPYHRMAQSYAYRAKGKEAAPFAEKAVAILKATDPKWNVPAGRYWFWHDIALSYELAKQWSDAAQAYGVLCDANPLWDRGAPSKKQVTLRYVRVGNHLIKAALDAGKTDEAKGWVARLKPQLPAIDAESAEAKTFHDLKVKLGL